MSGNPDNVQAGPGWLFVATIATPDPTDATTALGTAWSAIGYTEDGNVTTIEQKSEGLPVAEERMPVKTYITEQSVRVKFSMAEITARNLLMALNGGIVADPAAVEFSSGETRVKIVHETVTGARWLYRKCLQVGTVELASAKAPKKRLIPVEFALEGVPGLPPFTAWPDADGLI